MKVGGRQIDRVRRWKHSGLTARAFAELEGAARVLAWRW